MYPITNERIIEVIQDYSVIMENLNVQIENITKEFLSLDQNIYFYAAYKDTVYGRIGYSGGSDLSDTLKKMDKEERRYAEELIKVLDQLKKELNCNRRIHLCYMVLPYKEHELLRRMYEEKTSWGKLSIDLQVSISTLSRQRAQALKMIRVAYNSNLSNSDIPHLQKVQKRITWQHVIQEYQKSKTEEQKKEI